MHKNLHYILLALLPIIGCDSALENTAENILAEAEYVSLPVDVILAPGTLGTDLEFDEMDMPVTVTESYDLVPLQIGAFIVDLKNHDPDYLRVEFTSDRVEWVGYSTNAVNIYDSEEECRELEDHCMSTVVGEGTSGYFETSSGYAGIQNAYCRYSDEPYTYNITAEVYDLYVWPYVKISEPIQIEISCEISE